MIHNTNIDDIKNILKDEKATTYLMIWSTFEQKIFNGFMTKNKISNAAKRYSQFYDFFD